MPPGPGAPDGFPTTATWSWYEALGVYLLAFVLAGLATLPFIQLMEPETDLTNIVLTVVAALVIIGVLVLWLSRYHGGSRCCDSRNRGPGARRSGRASCSASGCIR